jgi:hypothetical protein
MELGGVSVFEKEILLSPKNINGTRGGWACRNHPFYFSGTSSLPFVLPLAKSMMRL